MDFRACEKIFDKTTGFDRSPEKSYDYFNTMKHGSIEQRETLIRELFKDTVQEVSENIISRVEMMVNEAHVPEMQREYLRQTQAEPAEKRAMNSFWNTYHSYYRPLLESVKESCNAAFETYNLAKGCYCVNSDKISEGYNRLNSVYAEINRLQEDIRNAKASKTCIKLFSLLIAAVNPAPAIILALLGSIITEAQKRSSISQIRNLRAQAKRIKTDIEHLKVKQEGLKAAKADTLKSYIAVKDEKESLKSEINALKGMLENTPAASKETLSELTRLSLDLNLLTCNFSCDPVYHSNGGVADFKVIHAGETLYASKLFRTERLTHLLDKWEGMTGQRPAYKIKTEQEVKERERIAQQRELRESMRYNSPRQSQGFKMKLG